MISVVNIEFYPSWFPPVLSCLHSSVLCKNLVTSLYLACVSPNFPILFCIKSLMLDLTNYIQIHTPMGRICLSIPTYSLPTCTRDSFHTEKGPRGSTAGNLSPSALFPCLPGLVLLRGPYSVLSSSAISSVGCSRLRTWFWGLPLVHPR